MQLYTDTIEVARPLKVGLWNHQPLLGDRLAMTSFVRDLKLTYPHWQIFVDVERPDPWAHNPHVAGVISPGTPPPEKFDIAWRIGPFAATQGSKTNGIHIMRAFGYGWTRKTGLPLQLGPVKPDLHLSDADRAYHPIAGDYWVVNPDTNNMGSKRWHPDRWRELFRARPDLHFVQVGLGAHAAIDYADEPNVTSLVDQTTERQLFALVAGASGCVSLVSSLMHVAAAFDKPCVVLAGGREPPTFEHYPAHQFISRVGALECCRDSPCWKNSIAACKRQVATEHGPVAACMLTIEPSDVARAIDVYYDGGRLPRAEGIPAVGGSRARTLRIVTNGKCYGGAERSCRTIAGLFHERGWQVEIATRQPMGRDMAEAFAPIAVTTSDVSGPCDVLLWYASDQVFDAHLEEFEPLRAAARAAGRTVMALTYKLGKVPTLDWCHDWDRYLFLCSEMRDRFAAKYTGPAGAAMSVLAPAVDLAPFLALPEPGEGERVRVVRHSSQGDNKWPESTRALVAGCPKAEFRFMPGPSWLAASERVTLQPAGSMTVPDFLAQGNLFCYLLPDGYSEQGPRVIVEAMAAGLPVIADNRWGAKDRVTSATGWLVDRHEQAVEIVNSVTPALLAAKGRAARQRAQTAFDPQRWVEAIIGE